MIGYVFVCCAIDCVCFYDLILELFDSVVLLFFHFIFPYYPTFILSLILCAILLVYSEIYLILCHQILQKENESTKVFTVQ
jgi:uncharacterized phage infection (PIP) family protein YhgE